MNKVKTGVKNKKNTFELFLGNKLVTIIEKIIKNKKGLEENKNWFDSQKCKHLIDENIQLICKYNDDFHSKNLMKIFNDNFSELNKKTFFTSLKNKQEEVISLKSNKEYEEMVILYNEIMQLILKQNENIIAYNNVYSNNVVSAKIIELHEIAKKNCENNLIYFLDESYHESKIDSWLEKNQNKKSKCIKNFDDNQKNIKSKIAYFEIKSSKFNEPDSKINKEKIDSVKKYNNNSIKNKEKIDFQFTIEKKWLYDNKEKIREIEGWIAKNKINIIFSNSYFEAILMIKENLEIQKEIDSLKKEKEKEIDSLKKDFIDNINDFVKQISGENFNLKIKITQRDDLEISSETKNIEHLSEGEKSTLALAYFFTDLKLNQKIDKNFIVFIDDPFDSNDHFKYDNLPNIKISNEKEGLSNFLEELEKKNKKKGSLIISTHNIHVLSSLIRNIIDNEQKFKCFRKIKNSDNKMIGLFYLEKTTSNNAILTELNKSLFFPMEDKIMDQIQSFWSYFCQTYSENKDISDVDLQIFILISALLTKLCDNNIKYSSDQRQDIKEYVKPFQPEELTCTGLKSKSRNTEINFKFSYREIEDFIKKTKLEYDPLLIEYLFFIRDRYNDILNSNDDKKLNRIRHKNNFHSSPIGHLLEE